MVILTRRQVKDVGPCSFCTATRLVVFCVRNLYDLNFNICHTCLKEMNSKAKIAQDSIHNKYVYKKKPVRPYKEIDYENKWR